MLCGAALSSPAPRTRPSPPSALLLLAAHISASSPHSHTGERRVRVTVTRQRMTPSPPPSLPVNAPTDFTSSPLLCCCHHAHCSSSSCSCCFAGISACSRYRARLPLAALPHTSSTSAGSTSPSPSAPSLTPPSSPCPCSCSSPLHPIGFVAYFYASSLGPPCPTLAQIRAVASSPPAASSADPVRDRLLRRLLEGALAALAPHYPTLFRLPSLGVVEPRCMSEETAEGGGQRGG